MPCYAFEVLFFICVVFFMPYWSPIRCNKAIVRAFAKFFCESVYVESGTHEKVGFKWTKRGIGRWGDLKLDQIC